MTTSTLFSKGFSLTLTGLVALGLLAPGLERLAAASGAVTPTISITEVLPNAVNENTGELFEILNTGSAAVDLTGWKFVDGSSV